MSEELYHLSLRIQCKNLYFGVRYSNVSFFYNKQISWTLCTTICPFVYHKTICWTLCTTAPYALSSTTKQYAELCVTPYAFSSTTKQYAELCVPPYVLLYTTNLYVELFMQLYTFVYHEANLANLVNNLMAFRVPPNAFSSTTKLIHAENYLTNHTVSLRPPLEPKYILWNFCGIWSLASYNIEIWSDVLSFSHYACFDKFCDNDTLISFVLLG